MVKNLTVGNVLRTGGKVASVIPSPIVGQMGILPPVLSVVTQYVQTGETKITLTWTSNVSYCVYDVCYANATITGWEMAELVKVTNISAQTHEIIIEANSEDEYYFKVRARYNAYITPLSNEVMVTPSLPPLIDGGYSYEII